MRTVQSGEIVPTLASSSKTIPKYRYLLLDYFCCLSRKEKLFKKLSGTPNARMFHNFKNTLDYRAKKSIKKSKSFSIL